MAYRMDKYGFEVDDDLGLPREDVSCPGCGRTYKQGRTVCKSCEECKRCCTTVGICEEPDHVPAADFIEQRSYE